MAGYKQNSSYGFGGYGSKEAQEAAIAAGLPEIRDQSKPLFTPGMTEPNSLQQDMEQDAGVFGSVPAFQSSYSKDYSGSDSGFGNSLDFTKRQNMILDSQNTLMSGGPSKRYSRGANYTTPAPEAKGAMDWFNKENMSAFASGAEGLGALASGWAALKNMKLQRDAYDTGNKQWEKNYGNQVTLANNAIGDRNAWRDANNMTRANYVGGQAPGKNYTAVT